MDEIFKKLLLMQTIFPEFSHGDAIVEMDSPQTIPSKQFTANKSLQAIVNLR
jgi:hypothetical protein